MATVVLGVIGAGIGSTFGPGGWKTGWAIGSVIGGLIDASNRPGIHTETGKLSDLRYSGSSYGTTLNQFWGKVKLPGSIIWVANYTNNTTLVPSGTANSTHLVEHVNTTNQGGGGSGGGGSSSNTTYTYSASYAVSFGASSFFTSDGNFVSRNPVIKRIWANDVLIYDVSNTAVNKTTIRFYYGDEIDGPDSLISLAEAGGVDANAPAYRGQVYIVIQDQDLSPFGNQIPNIQAEIWTDSVVVGDIVSDIATQSGLVDADIDVTNALASVTGYVVNNKTSAQDAINPLLSIYATDAYESDGLIKFIARGGASVVTIPQADMGCQVGGSEFDTILSRKLGVRGELPGRVDITYYDVDKQFEQVTQTAMKQSADFKNANSVGVSITMNADEAIQAAYRILDTSYLEISPFTFKTTWKYRWLTPSDVITIYDTNGTNRVRITSCEYGEPGELNFTAVLDDTEVLSQIATGSIGSGGGGSNSSEAIPCDFIAWSGLELREQDRNNVGFYVGATWPSNGKGGRIYYSTDAGTTWTYGGGLSLRTIFGTTASILADGTSNDTWDLTNDVDITITNDGLSVLNSTTEADVLNGNNVAMIGSELVGFVTASLTGSYAYTLSHLRRGIRNSPFTGHSSPEMFAVVSTALKRIVVDRSLIGSVVKVKVLGINEVLSDVTAIDVTISDNVLPPASNSIISPTYLNSAVNVVSAQTTTSTWATYDASGDIPANATHVILQAFGSTQGPDSAPKECVLQVRQQSGTIALDALRIKGAGNGDEPGSNSTLMCPVTTAQEFDWQIITNGFTEGATLQIVGYWGIVS